MAKQKSIIKLEGTIGDITFVKTQDGYLAKEKTSVNRNRIASDPAFKRTRENNAEFGVAGKGAKLLRTAFRVQMQQARDGRVIGRMVKLMMKVLQADTTGARGHRTVTNGEISFLQGFEYNIHAMLGSTLYVQYTATIDRASGKADVILPAFTPLTEIVAAQGATHFKIITAASEIDFTNESFTTVEQHTGIFPWDNTIQAATVLSNQLPAGSTKPLFLILGIQFFQMVNGTVYPLNNGKFNPLSIVQASRV